MQKIKDLQKKSVHVHIIKWLMKKTNVRIVYVFLGIRNVLFLLQKVKSTTS